MNDTKIIDAINKLFKSKNNYDINILYIDSHGKGETIKASNESMIIMINKHDNWKAI